MKYDPNIHHRRSIRLSGYNYSQPGAYFATICVDRRQCLFGEIIDGQMILNQYGMVVADEWQKSGVIRREIKLDAWVVMPNPFSWNCNHWQQPCKGERSFAPTQYSVTTNETTIIIIVNGGF
jgi:hypothetical protein